MFEEKDLAIEREFFRKNPSKGDFLNIVVIGSEVPPPQENTTLIKVRVTPIMVAAPRM